LTLAITNVGHVRQRWTETPNRPLEEMLNKFVIGLVRAALGLKKPGLVPVAKEVFDAHMPKPNQYDKQRPDVNVTAKELLDFRPETPITEAGLRNNISVGIQYLGSWLGGNGCVPVFNLMEDAATAEISRSQIWQWIRSDKGKLEDGRRVTKSLFRHLLAEELPKVREYVGEEAWAASNYSESAALFEKITSDDNYVEFLTLPAYERID
jgi:malate synthase